MTPDPIKSKIQELCPDVMLSANPAKWTITLAVVLRAIKTTGRPIGISCEGKFDEEKEYEVVLLPGTWNLEQDNYDAQSQEVKEFIGSLLGVV